MEYGCSIPGIPLLSLSPPPNPNYQLLITDSTPPLAHPLRRRPNCLRRCTQKHSRSLPPRRRHVDVQWQYLSADARSAAVQGPWTCDAVGRIVFDWWVGGAGVWEEDSIPEMRWSVREEGRSGILYSVDMSIGVWVMGICWIGGRSFGISAQVAFVGW